MQSSAWQTTTADPTRPTSDSTQPSNASPVRGTAAQWNHAHTSSGGSSSGKASVVASDARSGNGRISSPDSRTSATAQQQQQQQQQHRTCVDPNMSWMRGVEPTYPISRSARSGSSYHGPEGSVSRGVPVGNEWAGKSAVLHDALQMASSTSSSLVAAAAPPFPPPRRVINTDTQGIDSGDNEVRVNTLDSIWGTHLLPLRQYSGASSATGESQTSSSTVMDRDRRPSGLENVPRPPSRSTFNMPSRRTITTTATTTTGVDARMGGGQTYQDDAARVFLTEGSSSLMEAKTPPTHSWVPLPADTLLMSGTTAAAAGEEEEDEDAELQAAIDAATARLQDLSSEEGEEEREGIAAAPVLHAHEHGRAPHPFFGSAMHSSTSSAPGREGRPLQGVPQPVVGEVGDVADPALSHPLSPTHAPREGLMGGGARHGATATATSARRDGTVTPASLDPCGSDSIMSPFYAPPVRGAAGALLHAGSEPAPFFTAAVGSQAPVTSAGAPAAAAGVSEPSPTGLGMPSTAQMGAPSQPTSAWCATQQPGPSAAASPTGTLAGMSASRRPSAAARSRSFSGTSFTSPPLAALQLASPPQDAPGGGTWCGVPADAAMLPHRSPHGGGSGRGVQRPEDAAASVLCVSPPPMSIAAAHRGGRGGYPTEAVAHYQTASSAAAAAAGGAGAAVATHATAVNSLLSSPSAPSFQTYHMPHATLVSDYQLSQQQPQHPQHGSPHMMLYSPPQVYMGTAAGVASLSSSASAASPVRFPPSTAAPPPQQQQQQQQQQIVAGCTLTPSLSSSAAAAAASSSIQSSRASRNLYFRNLPRSWNTTVLRELCSGYGAVMSAKVAHHPTTNESLGYGFVLFENTACAAMCVATLNQALIKTEGEETRTLLVRMAHASAAPGFQEDPEEAAMAAAGGREEGQLHVLGVSRRSSRHGPAVHAIVAAAGGADITALAASALSSPHSRESSFVSSRALSPTALAIGGADGAVPVAGDVRQLGVHVLTNAGAVSADMQALHHAGLARTGYPVQRSQLSPHELAQDVVLQQPTGGVKPRIPVSSHGQLPATALSEGAFAASGALSGSFRRVPSGSTLPLILSPLLQQQQQQQPTLSGRGTGHLASASLPGPIAVSTLSLSPTIDSSLQSPCRPPVLSSPSTDAVGGNHAATVTATSARNVYVTNLPLTWNTTRLRDACAPYGPIVSASVAHHPTTNESRGYGFVLFSDAKDAAACVAALHQHHVPDTPNVLVCRFAKEKATPSIAADSAVPPSGATTVTETARAAMRVSGATSPIVGEGSAFNADGTLLGAGSQGGVAGGGASLDVGDAVLMPIEVFSTLQERVYAQCLHHMQQQQQQQQQQSRGRDGEQEATYWAKATTPLGLTTSLTAEQQAELERRMRLCVVYGSYVPGQASPAETVSGGPPSATRQASPATTSPVQLVKEMLFSAGGGAAGVVNSFALPVADATRSPSASTSMTSPAEGGRPVREVGWCHTPSNETASSRAASTSPHTGTPLLHLAGGGGGSGASGTRGSRSERWWYTCTLFSSPEAAEAFMKEAADVAARSRRTGVAAPSFEDALSMAAADVPGASSAEGRSLLTRYGRCERVLVFRGDHAPLAASEGRTPPSASTSGTPTTRDAAGATPPQPQTQAQTQTPTRTVPPPPPPRSQQSRSPVHSDTASGGSSAGPHVVAVVPAVPDVRGEGRSAWATAASSTAPTAPAPPRPRSASLLQAPPLPTRPPPEQRFPSPVSHSGSGTAAAVVEAVVPQREHHATPAHAADASSHPLPRAAFTSYTLHAPPATTNSSARLAVAEPSTGTGTAGVASTAAAMPYGAAVGGVAPTGPGPMTTYTSLHTNASGGGNSGSSTAVPDLRRTSPSSAATGPSVYHPHNSSAGSGAGAMVPAGAYASARIDGGLASAGVPSMPGPFVSGAMGGVPAPGGYALPPDGLFQVQGFYCAQVPASHPGN